MSDPLHFVPKQMASSHLAGLAELQWEASRPDLQPIGWICLKRYSVGWAGGGGHVAKQWVTRTENRPPSPGSWTKAGRQPVSGPEILTLSPLSPFAPGTPCKIVNCRVRMLHSAKHNDSVSFLIVWRGFPQLSSFCRKSRHTATGTNKQQPAISPSSNIWAVVVSSLVIHLFICNWRITALQYCAGLCHTSRWGGHR